MPPVSLTLYGTSACHLCEQAAAALQPLAGNGVVVQQVDITESETLMQRYQLRIPVLRRDDTGAELDYPFGLGELMEWLSDAIGEEG
jgi:glutaredoxin-related protein